MTDALSFYEAFAEPDLNTHELDILADITEDLDLKVDGNKMAHTHPASLDLALDKFSGTDSDQDIASFIQLIERKINFALGDAPADADDFANYTFRNKALFSSLPRRPAGE